MRAPLLRLLAVALASRSLAFAPLGRAARPRARARGAAKAGDEQLRVTLATTAAGSAFAYDVQKQLWLIRRCAATYSVAGGEVAIVAEGSRKKLEAFLKWATAATAADGPTFIAERGDGSGLRSVEWAAAEGALAGWTCDLGEAADAAAAGGGEADGAGLSADDEVVRAASVAATSGVVGTVPLAMRESLVAKSFGSAALDAGAGADDDELSDEELEKIALDLACSTDDTIMVDGAFPCEMLEE